MLVLGRFTPLAWVHVTYMLAGGGAFTPPPAPGPLIIKIIIQGEL